MERQIRMCPRCREQVEMIDDGTGPGTNDFGDPIIFVEHDRDDWRADLKLRTRCPGSGMNMALARQGAR